MQSAETTTVSPSPTQTQLAPPQPLQINILGLGPRDSGKEALLRRLHLDRFDADYYNPTLEVYSHRTRYQLGHDLPDAIANFSKLTYSADHTALVGHMIEEHEVLLLVYRAGDASGLEVLERLYNDYIAGRRPRQVRYVVVVATCIDLMPASAAGNPSPGRAFAARCGLEFVPVSAKTGEGCGGLEAVLRAAVEKRQRR